MSTKEIMPYPVDNEKIQRLVSRGEFYHIEVREQHYDGSAGNRLDWSGTEPGRLVKKELGHEREAFQPYSLQLGLWKEIG